MNHRSNMDYVLVSFLAAERVALSYAVGEWARIWPLQGLIRAMGAYFVRRNSGDPLYRMVLQRYVQMATEGGVPQAMYPEGGLTTDGRLREPKLGLLDYMLKGFDPKRRSATSSSSRSASTTTACSRTARCCARVDPSAGKVGLGRTLAKTGAVRSSRQVGPRGARPALSPRLRLRQLRHAGVDARLRRRAGGRLPGARRRRPAPGGRRGRRDADGADRRRRSGAAGAAGRERAAARPDARRSPSSS